MGGLAETHTNKNFYGRDGWPFSVAFDQFGAKKEASQFMAGSVSLYGRTIGATP